MTTNAGLTKGLVVSETIPASFQTRTWVSMNDRSSPNWLRSNRHLVWLELDIGFDEIRTAQLLQVEREHIGILVDELQDL